MDIQNELYKKLLPWLLVGVIVILAATIWVIVVLRKKEELERVDDFADLLETIERKDAVLSCFATVFRVVAVVTALLAVVLAAAGLVGGL